MEKVLENQCHSSTRGGNTTGLNFYSIFLYMSVSGDVKTKHTQQSFQYLGFSQGSLNYETLKLMEREYSVCQ